MPVRKEPDELRKEGVFIRLTAETIKQIDEIADYEQSTRSQVIRGILLKALRGPDDFNPLERKYHEPA